MNVMIVGSDGYLGWSLANHLLRRGDSVVGIDNGIRRRAVAEVGGDSLTPLEGILKRHNGLGRNGNYYFFNVSTLDYDALVEIVKTVVPDVIVHLGELPSAPYSMLNPKASVVTQHGNVIGTLNLLWVMRQFCPNAHLIKLGTMGEYGTQEDVIPEGDFKYHKQPGSFYHLSKVHDSFNIEFACRTWGLRSTDIMQGVVYGMNKVGSLTRFDYDEAFGTAINRFMVQALCEHPLTVYGEGGQTRGFLPLQDSMQCLQIVMDNPPQAGEYRIVNQFENTYSVQELAEMVAKVAGKIGYEAVVEHVPNPRKEKERHDYQVVHQWLLDHGYKPTTDMESEIEATMRTLESYKMRIRPEVIRLDIKWA